jgi:hypothetical protein
MGLPTEVSNVHGAWHSPNTLHTMVRGSVFLITIWQSPRQIWGCAGHLCGWSHGNRNWQDWNPTLVAIDTVVNQTIIRSRPRQTRYPLVRTTLHFSFFLNLHHGIPYQPSVDIYTKDMIILRSPSIPETVHVL